MNQTEIFELCQNSQKNQCPLSMNLLWKSTIIPQQRRKETDDQIMKKQNENAIDYKTKLKQHRVRSLPPSTRKGGKIHINNFTEMKNTITLLMRSRMAVVPEAKRRPAANIVFVFVVSHDVDTMGLAIMVVVAIFARQ